MTVTINGTTGLATDSTSAVVEAVSLNHPSSSTAAITMDASNNVTLASNLTMTGGIYLGGTGSDNLISEYEQGTFTPVIQYSGTNTPSHTQQLGRYTKVGRVVQIQIYINWGENSSTGDITLTSLPFTSLSSIARAVPSVLSFGLTGLPTNVSVTGFVSNNTTDVTLFLNDNSATVLSDTYTDTDQDMYITVTYEAA